MPGWTRSYDWDLIRGQIGQHSFQEYCREIIRNCYCGTNICNARIVWKLYRGDDDISFRAGIAIHILSLGKRAHRSCILHWRIGKNEKFQDNISVPWPDTIFKVLWYTCVFHTVISTIIRFANSVIFCREKWGTRSFWSTLLGPMKDQGIFLWPPLEIFFDPID